MTIQNSTDIFGTPGIWYVHPTLGSGTHQTISAAITSASNTQSIYVAPGFTYTENLTISKNITIFSGDSPIFANGFGQGAAVIVGQITISGSANVQLQNLLFENTTSSTSTLTYSSTGNSTIINCNFNNQNTLQTHITTTGLNLDIVNCNFNGNSSSCQLFAASASSNIFRFFNCRTQVSNGYQTASTISSGILTIQNCEFDCVISSSSTSSVHVLYTSVTNIGNNTFLTCGGTVSPSDIISSSITTGTAAAVSISAGATCTIADTVINSTNANPITGLGTLNYTNIDQISGTPGTFNTSTIVGRETDIGTLNLKNALTVANGGTGLATMSTYQLLTGGTTATGNLQQVASTGTSGQILTSNGSGALPTFQTAPSGVFAPNAVVNIFDEFIGSDGAPATEVRGALIWQNSGATWSITTAAASNAHPGVLANRALASASCIIMLVNQQNTAATNYTQIILGGGQLTVNWVFNLATLSDGTNRYTLRFGLGDTVNADQVNGVYFEYSDNINSGKWVYKTASSSSRTTANSTTTASVGWHNAQMVINAAASSIQFNMDGVSLGSPATLTIPTAAISPFFEIKRELGTIPAEALIVDLFYMSQILTTPR